MLQLYTHALLAVLCLASVLYLFLQRSSFRIITVRKYFIWFALFFFYNLVLAVATFLFSDLPFFAAVSYRIALFFLALGAWQAYVMGLAFLSVVKRANEFLSLSYLIGVLIAVVLHIIFFEIPQAANEDWIFWYANKPVSLFYAFFMFLAGWTVALALVKNIFSLNQKSLQIRSALFASAASILPIAAFLYFGASEVVQLERSLWIVGVALIFFLIGNVGVGMLRKH